MSEETKELTATQTNEVETNTTEQLAEEVKEVNEAEFTDSQPEEKQVQTREQNREFARQRREKERQEELAKTRMEAVFDALDGVNPFTQEKMVDKEDYEEYLRMKDMKKNGLDPLLDSSKYQKEKERKARLEAERQEEMNQKARSDIDAFKSEFPNEDVGKLLEDEDFQVCLKAKGNLKDAYVYLNQMRAKYQKEADMKSAQKLANAQSSVGSVNSNGTQDTSFYTEEQVRNMSRDEIMKNYDKIRQSMNKW